MENQKKLHEVGLCLVMLAIVDLVHTILNAIDIFIDDKIDEMIASATNPDVANLLRPTLVVIAAVAMLLAIGQILIGVKGMNISKAPTAAKGHITAATVFLVLNAIAVVSSVYDLISGAETNIISGALSIVTLVLDVVLFALFIKAAKAVRKDAQN